MLLASYQPLIGSLHLQMKTLFPLFLCGTKSSNITMVSKLKDVCKSLQSNKIYAKMGLGSTGKEKKNLCYCVGILVVTFLLGR